MEKKNIDWSNIGFGYMPTDYRYVSMYQNGSWDEGALTSDPNITLNECACVLQYAQTCFEGLKAYTTEAVSYTHLDVYKRQAADRAQFLISQCAALLAVTHILLGFQNRAGQVPDLFFRHIDDMKCKTLRRFTSDSGKF